MDRLLIPLVVGLSLAAGLAVPPTWAQQVPPAPGGADRAWPTSEGSIDYEHQATDVVLFAAGAVQLQAPWEWRVLEVPHGREIRLLLLPPGVSPSRVVIDGIWLTYHILPEHAAPMMDEWAQLADMNARRALLATGSQATLSEPQAVQIGQWPAAQQEFVVAERDRHAPEASPDTRGYHISSRTPWGVFELHFRAPAADYEQRSAAFDAVVAGLRLDAPRAVDVAAVAAVSQAQPIIGSWKAYRSRLSLGADGQVRIVIDPPDLRAIDQAVAPETLQGAFTAEQDVLYVQWSDGSRLTFRWRLHDQDLLLTDHQGQTIRLRRVLQ